ncbi:Oligosaccharide translocation protein rft1 [Ascosphaera aggregata]|nr:Oligosaccharide translocation protein rft1 [Ascosphaera aggregata]
MASGLAYLILIQVISRGFTSIANQFMLRYLSPGVLGAATQLEIYSNSVLYFARESVRLALQRQSEIGSDKDSENDSTDRSGVEKDTSGSQRSKDQIQGAINVASLSVLMGLGLTYVLGLFQARVSKNVSVEIPYFNEGLQLTGWACMFELLSEPAFAFVQWRNLLKKRAAIESTAAVMRCVAACITAVMGARRGISVGVLPHAMGQLAFALTILVGYVAATAQLIWREDISLLPRPLNHAPTAIWGRFNRPLIILAANLYGQSIVKHLLTQGDSMTLATMTSLEDQGLYALASNYGSVVARVIFQPIEESSRNLFGRLLTTGEGNHRKVQRGRIAEAKEYLCVILRLYVTGSILILSLGPVIVPQVLSTLLGSRWSSLSLVKILSSYCYYIPILALNGVLEAFVSSTASHSQLRRQSLWMIVCSVDFIAVAYIFLSVMDSGASGIVWANITNMVFRIAWSFRHIKNYFSEHDMPIQLSDFVPSLWTLTMGGAAFAIMPRVRSLPNLNVPEYIQITGVGATLAVITLASEMSFFYTLYGRYRHK